MQMSKIELIVNSLEEKVQKVLYELAELKNDNTTFEKLKAQLLSLGIPENQIKIKTANITLDKMAADSVDTTQIKNNAITTDKITDLNVTRSKLALGVIDDTRLENNAVREEHILNDEYVQADQWKIYPCQTTPYTVIKQWYDNGKYKPYSQNMIDLLNNL